MKAERPDAACTLITDGSEHFLAWPLGRGVPSGWTEVGQYGTRDELAGYVRNVLAETAPAPLHLTERPETWWGDFE
jgi:uncharacterized protein YbdZ (MbtH family)